MTYALLLAFSATISASRHNGLPIQDIWLNVQARGTRAALFVLSCVVLIVAFLICRAW